MGWGKDGTGSPRGQKQDPVNVTSSEESVRGQNNVFLPKRLWRLKKVKTFPPAF